MRKVASLCAVAAFGFAGLTNTPEASAGSPYGIHYSARGLHIGIGHVHHYRPYYQRSCYSYPRPVYHGRYPAYGHAHAYRGYVQPRQRFYPYGYTTQFHRSGRGNYCRY